MIEKDKMVCVNDDDRELGLKALSKIYTTARELYRELKDNSLTEEMKEMLFSLIESYTAEASKVLGYDANATAKIEERYAEIREANGKIHELENLLAKNSQVAGLKDLLYSIHNAMFVWWQKQGFNLVSDDSFGNFGYKATFYLDTSRISFIARKPVTERNEQKSRLEEMIEEGYEFIEEDRQYVLLDNMKNRKLLSNLVKTKFPSIDIYKWNNWSIRKSDDFRLTSFDAYIRSFEELKALADEISEEEQIDGSNN